MALFATLGLVTLLTEVMSFLLHPGGREEFPFRPPPDRIPLTAATGVVLWTSIPYLSP